MRRPLPLLLLLCATLTAQSATIIDFESPLASYSGLTFSASISRWLSPGGSVVNNPNLGPVTPTYGICAGPCGGGVVGEIAFASPQAAVGIYALSGPGNDLINPGTEIRAYDAMGNLVDQDVADPTLQYDFVSVRAPGIARVELQSVPANNEAWDELVFSTSGFLLEVAPRAVPVGTACEFQLTKQPPGTPVVLAAVDVLGIPTSIVLSSGSADPRGRWSLRIAAMPALPGFVVTLRGFSLDHTAQLISTNDVAFTIQ